MLINDFGISDTFIIKLYFKSLNETRNELICKDTQISKYSVNNEEYFYNTGAIKLSVPVSQVNFFGYWTLDKYYY